MDLSPRAVIAGRYRVDTKVGAGGMGEVWLGEHLAVGVRVAVKTLLPAASMNHEVVARFKREAYILGRIRSDHVARVVDFVADDAYGLVLVMEFVEGEPLSRLLQERALTVEEGIELAFGLASALKDLHAASIIHRDLKPGNVMMQPLPDGRRRAVVVDFGVSRLMADKDKDEDEEITGITRADMAVGTIEYMAPEQILNSRSVTPGSDIYAAGAMLFRSCAGRHVYGNVASDTELAQKKLTTEAPALPMQRTDKLAEGFAKVVARMVKRRPSERYKTAGEVLEDLLPLRAMARDASELDTTTVDTKSVLPRAAAEEVAVAAAPQAPAQAHGQTQQAAPARAPAQPIPQAAQPAPPPVGDSSVSVSAPPGPGSSAPARRGVPVVVTLGLVAAALGGGVVLGPRILELGGVAIAPGAAPAPASAPASALSSAASASASAASAPLDSASAAPLASASSAAPADAASASAKPVTMGGEPPSPSAQPGASAALDAGAAAKVDGGAARPAVSTWGAPKPPATAVVPGAVPTAGAALPPRALPKPPSPEGATSAP
jgi:serine/threonine-protein kinase